MLTHISEVSYPHQNKKDSPINTRRVPSSLDLRFFICGDTYKFWRNRLQFKMKRYFINQFCTPVKTFGTSPRPLQGCNSP